MNYPIIPDTNPLIRTRSRQLSFPLSAEDNQLLDNLERAFAEYSNTELCQAESINPAIGLSAIQIGYPIAVFIFYEANSGANIMAINPRILRRSSSLCYVYPQEGCMSVAEAPLVITPRHLSIEVRFYDRDGHSQTMLLTDLEAVIFQHEYDHLSGILFYDRGVLPDDPQVQNWLPLQMDSPDDDDDEEN